MKLRVLLLGRKEKRGEREREGARVPSALRSAGVHFLRFAPAVPGLEFGSELDQIQSVYP